MFMGDVTTLLPVNEKFVRMYNAFEGGLRVISKDSKGNEHRYDKHIYTNMTI